MKLTRKSQDTILFERLGEATVEKMCWDYNDPHPHKLLYSFFRFPFSWLLVVCINISHSFVILCKLAQALQVGSCELDQIGLNSDKLVHQMVPRAQYMIYTLSRVHLYTP
jgi:hypothetical protein